jgi:hypothetical protein
VKTKHNMVYVEAAARTISDALLDELTGCLDEFWV